MIRHIKSLIGERSVLRIGWHKLKSLLAALRYGFPARTLTVIGISGTDGKTTTVGMTAHILQKNGIAVGAASTAFLQIGSDRMENATHLTSLSPFALQKFLRELVRRTCTHAVLEMSSHGLVQGRVSWTFPRIAAITNIALEHLDYHGTMERYRADKGIMFHMLRGHGTKIVNASDESFGFFSAIPSAQQFSFGRNGDLEACDVRGDATSSQAIIRTTDGRSMTLTLSVPGTYNIDNALCAILCAKACGVSEEHSVKALESFEGIPGRLERIDEGQPFSLYVDFAVSPQAYEKTLQAMRTVANVQHSRVLVLCGSCGNRMREKRPEIGRICSALADVVVATEDETYGEDPHNALEEMWNGVDQSSCEAHKIFDRTEAITFLCKNARAGDVVVLCGMGPFSTFTKLEGRIPWDERKVARRILRAL